ncbi:1-deoxy-D-xylulose-5-phosphate synthase [Veillonella parvula]|uniref:1-deoxy-D-xylulose-5-phosphate synthase n=1 Tax=Veillonella parvula TaxID=29466 RepID=UPI000766E754|nr:1-deoxy-D-xylulose-5-phosphate synthase [Veillonella parvula]
MNLIDVKSPADLKGLSISELTDLTAQARQALMTKVSEHGGHFGPPMGAAEMIMALHYVFNSPVDKIVYDVSHQSYAHKMVTGRALAFLDHDHYDDVTGYTDPTESEHDFFNIGHTSTSISLASGLATARNLKGDSENIIAIIGDGSLSGGEAFEGLDYAATLNSNMIIIVNDNDQSIAENHGGLYRGLRELRESNGESPNNIFKALGLDYRFVADGNDLETLIDVFKAVKDIDHPIVLHIVTQKGKGYAIAEQNKEAFHWTMPFDLETGKPKEEETGPTYAGTIANYLMEQIKVDPTVVAINAGTPGGFGFTPEWRKAAGKQYIDVGIAEEHAIAMSSGIAKNGGKPVFNVYSTFLQRTYDQLVQDLCVNNNSAVIINHYASVYGMNDVTHLGFFDIPMLTSIPNLVYLAPTNNEELLAMTEYAVHQHKHPVAIRVPVGEFTTTGVADTTDYSILNKSEVTRRGEGIALLGLGNFYHLANQVADELAKEGINATVVNPKFASGLDEELLEELKANHSVVFTLEDGVVEGGWGQRVASFYGPSNMRVKNYGIAKEFHDRYDATELLRENGVSLEQIVADAKQVLSV